MNFYIAQTVDEPLENVVVTGSAKTPRDEVLMTRICKVYINGNKSPLCDDRNLYFSWKNIFQSKGISRDIALGIMYAESHIWSSYKWCDASWNNRWGVKARVLDDGKVSRDQKIPNWWNCWLYKFESMEDYFNSKANMLWVNYRWCFQRKSTKEKIICISYSYVWDPKVSETHWVNNVLFIAK